MLSKLKRKYIFIPVMIAFCIGMYYGAVSVQNYYYHKEDAKNKIVSTKNTNLKVPDAKQESSNQTNSAVDTSKSSASTNPSSSSQTSTAKSSSNNQNLTTQQQSQTNKSSSSASSSTSAPTTTPAPSQPAQQSNCSIIIWDDVNKKTIVSANIYVDGKTSVEKITTDVLDSNGIVYHDKGNYFSMIAKLYERNAGQYSGWCYYVNGKKGDRSVGSYILQAGDKLEWKYLADGLSN